MHLQSIAPLHGHPQFAAREASAPRGAALAGSNPSPVRWRLIVGWLRRG
jgi:hypothetical protein